LFRWEVLEEVLSDRARLQGMLDFEAALARAEARTGVIPASAAPAIAGKCQAERFDLAVLARAGARSGNLAIPLVDQLRAQVAADDAEAARFVHWGATSQDAIDTGCVLQLRQALERIEPELATLADALARLARDHRATPAVARTWMQHALPTTFGLKAAGWLAAVDRDRARMAALRRLCLVLQFGGAVGTLAALGSKGLDVAEALGEDLGLAVPEVSWHTHRDRLAEVATAAGICTGTLGKIARDLALSAQTELSEVSEAAAEGRGGSSTLPHKRNPVACATILAAATRMPGLVSSMLSAMPQEEERGLGGWQAEWETLPEILGVFGGALHRLSEAVGGLVVDTARMRANLEATRGLIFAEAVQMELGRAIGLARAHQLVAEACGRAQSEGRHLREVLEADPGLTGHLGREQLERLFDPLRYLGAADRLIDRALAAHASGVFDGRD
jgi:3-carboxy-cis,cis-muconate cycloisomerase